jgi:signal transduction histidine kinase
VGTPPARDAIDARESAGDESTGGESAGDESRGGESARNESTLSAHLVCISTDVNASAALQWLVQAVLPSARVEAADTSIVRGAPDADCVVLSVGTLYASGVALARELRACGYARALVLVVQSPKAVSREDCLRLGVDAIVAEAALALKLPGALRDVFDRAARHTGSRSAAAMTASLQRLQATLALGETARGLQHRLNNPLAALLAEAQLLELEPLAPEHLLAVRRIVELCRRVVDESRTMEWVPEEP